MGMRLVGTRHPSNQKRIDRPVIALMDYEGSPHYIVLKPVLPDSSIIQVLDPPFAPDLLPLDRLMDNPAWTGMILQPMSLPEELIARGRAVWPPLFIITISLSIGLCIAIRVRRMVRAPRFGANVWGSR